MIDMTKRTPCTREADCHHCGRTNKVVLFVPAGAVFYKGDLVCTHCRETYAATIPVADPD